MLRRKHGVVSMLGKFGREIDGLTNLARHV